MNTWNERLIARMRELGLRQVDIRKRVGVSNYTVSAWVHGEHEPTGEHLVKLCRAIHCRPQWLIDGETPMTYEERVSDADRGEYEIQRGPYSNPALDRLLQRLVAATDKGQVSDEMLDAIRTLIDSVERQLDRAYEQIPTTPARRSVKTRRRHPKGD